MLEEFTYTSNGISYPVKITYKKIKNIHYRFNNGVFNISSPKGVSKAKFINGLDKFAISLIERSPTFNGIGDDYIYLLGIKVSIHNFGEINFSNGNKIVYKSKDDLYKKVKKWFLEVVTSRVRYYEKIMLLKENKVSVRNTKTRYGSNSKRTNTVAFSTMLMHFPIEIIDSVVVHELSHCLVFNHSKDFYDVVYKYCPNYKELRKKLRKGEF